MGRKSPHINKNNCVGSVDIYVFLCYDMLSYNETAEEINYV